MDCLKLVAQSLLVCRIELTATVSSDAGLELSLLALATLIGKVILCYVTEVD